MLKHILALCGSVLVCATIAGLLGEAMFPSGPFIGASVWLGCVASIVAAVVYVLAALGWSDYFTLRKKKTGGAVTVVRKASITALVTTTVATMVFCTGVMLHWISW